MWPKMTKNAYFGPNLPVLWPKILILTGGSKSFGTHITEKPPRHLARIVYWSGMGPNGPKMPIFGQKSQFWANLAIYGPKILIFMWVSKSFGIHITEKPPRQLVRIVFRSGIGLNGPKCPYLAKNASFGPNLAVFCPISSHACWHLRHIRRQNTKTSLYKLSKNG